MKRIVVLMLAAVLLGPSVMAGDGKKKKADDKAGAEAAVANSDEIHWMTLDEVQTAMKKEPRKVYMDVYTDWCGWCKVMEKKTFTNKSVAHYINQKFYAVRLNAEQKDSIRFLGKVYGFVPENRANELALELLRGQLSYPTSVVLEENFQNPQPIPGYLDVPTMEMVLTYLGENIYKKTPFADYQKDFKSTWPVSAENMPPQSAH